MDIHEQKENKSEQKRLKILNEDVIETLYGRPRFTHEERRNYFDLSQPEKDLLQLFRSIKSQTYFVLQLGYFKAKHLFFTFDLQEVAEDLQYVLVEYFENSKISNLSSIDKFTRLKQQHIILELFNFRLCDAEERHRLEEKACKAVAVCGKPIYIFHELMHYLSEQCIVAPGYSFIQKTVSKALTYEQKRLLAIMHSHLSQVGLP